MPCNRLSTCFIPPRKLLAVKRRKMCACVRVALVKEGSVVRNQDTLDVDFVVTDGDADVTIRYGGILPDLFREGQGIVAMGRLNESGVLITEKVLAKHDENYMLPEVSSALEETGMLKHYEEAQKEKIR